MGHLLAPWLVLLLVLAVTGCSDEANLDDDDDDTCGDDDTCEPCGDDDDSGDPCADDDDNEQVVDVSVVCP